MAYRNVALGCRASQSSRSVWSKGSTVEDDAAGATSGDRTKEFGFHTDSEKNPWWMVDLGAPHDIKEIRVYNRPQAVLLLRASPILIETSLDCESWSEFFRAEPRFVFGGDAGDNLPLIRAPQTETHAQYVRISVLSETYLHLAEVEVYGAPVEALPEPAVASAAGDTVADESPAEDETPAQPGDEPPTEVAADPANSGPAEAPPPPAAKKPAEPPRSGGWLSFLGW